LFIKKSTAVVSIFFFAALRNPAFVSKAERQLQVQKIYKLYIGGKFVRGENGRVLPASGEPAAR
jgi:hypothetical protein